MLISFESFVRYFRSLPAHPSPAPRRYTFLAHLVQIFAHTVVVQSGEFCGREENTHTHEQQKHHHHVVSSNARFVLEQQGQHVLMKCFLCARDFVHFFPRFLSFSIIKDDAAKDHSLLEEELYEKRRRRRFIMCCVYIYIFLLGE